VKKVRIEVYEGGVPSAAFSVPLWLITGASKLMPKIAGKRLEQHVDLGEIAALITNPQAAGTLLEIEDHMAEDRIVISIVGDEAAPGAFPGSAARG
jgi:hypothetical protein